MDLDFLNIEEIAKKENFEGIAQDLMLNYCIQKGETYYEFSEIECYLYSEKHPDIITYPRKVRRGDWLFHASGVDICFGKEDCQLKNDDDCYGGILIRSLIKHSANTQEQTPFNGPLNCCYELFDQFSALPTAKESFEYPILVEKSKTDKNWMVKEENEIKSCARYFKFDDIEKKYHNILKKNFNDKERITTLKDFKIYLEKEYRFFHPEAMSRRMKDANGKNKSYSVNLPKDSQI